MHSQSREDRSPLRDFGTQWSFLLRQRNHQSHRFFPLIKQSSDVCFLSGENSENKMCVTRMFVICTNSVFQIFATVSQNMVKLHHQNTLKACFTTILVCRWNSCVVLKRLNGYKDQILNKTLPWKSFTITSNASKFDAVTRECYKHVCFKIWRARSESTSAIVSYRGGCEGPIGPEGVRD